MKPFAAVVTVIGLALPVLVGAPRQAAQTSCIEVGGISVWGVTGYNHIVYLTNRCEQKYACVVSTDVDPKPIDATVPPNTTVSVVTAVNSRAGWFLPKVACEPASD